MTKTSIYIVTGSSNGIGKSICERLVQNKENHVIGISKSKGISAPNYSEIIQDLSIIEEVKRIQFPDPVNIQSITLINNAGILGEIAPLKTMKLDHIEDIINVNYTAVMILNALFIQKYQELPIRKTIINISSGAATGAYASWANYCSSKAALEMLTRCVVEEQKIESYPIHCFALAPGVVNTNMQAHIRATEIEHFAMKPKFEELYTNDQLYDPAIVADKIIDLALQPDTYKETIFRISL